MNDYKNNMKAPKLVVQQSYQNSIPHFAHWKSHIPYPIVMSIFEVLLNIRASSHVGSSMKLSYQDGVGSEFKIDFLADIAYVPSLDQASTHIRLVLPHVLIRVIV